MPLSSLFQARDSTGTGLRGFLNRYPILIGAVVIIVAAYCIFTSVTHTGRQAGQAFFTVDDGATFFSAAAHAPPFDYHGKQAVGAIIYSCDGGKTRFVGYLYRFTPEGRERAEKMLQTHRGGPRIGMEVKKPGAGDWVPAGVGPRGPSGPDAAASIMTVKCPDGGAPYIINPP